MRIYYRYPPVQLHLSVTSDSIVTFGIITLGTAFIQGRTSTFDDLIILESEPRFTDRAGFYVTRILLGMAEAVTMPGLRCACRTANTMLIDSSLISSYMLTRYYRRSEITSRIGCFMLVAAGSAGGCMDSHLMLSGRKLYLPFSSRRSSGCWLT